MAANFSRLLALFQQQGIESSEKEIFVARRENRAGAVACRKGDSSCHETHTILLVNRQPAACLAFNSVLNVFSVFYNEYSSSCNDDQFSHTGAWRTGLPSRITCLLAPEWGFNGWAGHAPGAGQGAGRRTLGVDFQWMANAGAPEE
jgi:hypothetical protein